MADTDADLKTLHVDNADLLREMQALRSEIAALRAERSASGA